MAWNWFRKLAANPTAKIEMGERGEKFAARHLRRQGYKILVRRFKTRAGEIDLVCRHGEWLVFIEVKTRQDLQLGAPADSVDDRKQRAMSKVALEYLRLLKYPQVKWRFDIVEIIWPRDARKPTSVRVHQNAFDLSAPFVY
jgi:putative endonuclease